MAKAASGSAHFKGQIALIASRQGDEREVSTPAPTERHPPSNAALLVAPASRRFSLASHGITAVAATNGYA